VSEPKKVRLEVYSHRVNLLDYYTTALLWLADKVDSSKRCIHHLLFQAGLPTAINSRIPEHYGTIAYTEIEDGIVAVEGLGQNCILLKRDFESSFRHIPISPED